MATITNPELAITTDLVQHTATIVVTCGVEFTQFEVNAMTQLGLSYTLHCDLLNMEMLYPESTVVFAAQEFPRLPGRGQSHDDARFEAVAAMKALHVYLFGKDSLVAELTLTNAESGTSTSRRTPIVAVSLAA
jgi:hypothetical protein